MEEGQTVVAEKSFDRKWNYLQMMIMHEDNTNKTKSIFPVPGNMNFHSLIVHILWMFHVHLNTSNQNTSKYAQRSGIKGRKRKNVSLIFFVFAISQLLQPQNLKILVPTPHTTLVIMWGRDKNFQVLMLYELRNNKNKKHARYVFALPPFVYLK